jgi:hypothetical protein
MKHAVLLVVTAAASGLGGYLLRGRHDDAATVGLITADRILVWDSKRNDGKVDVSIRGDRGFVRIDGLPILREVTLNPVFTPPAIPNDAFEASRLPPQGK